MNRVFLAAVLLVACSRKLEAQKTNEQAASGPRLPPGFVVPKGRGEQPLFAGAPELWVTTQAVTSAVDGPPIVVVPSDAKKGFAPDVKRSGPNDLLVVPLHDAMKKARGDGPKKLSVHADARTPYRILVEIVFSASQAGFDTFAVAVSRGAVHVVVPNAQDLPMLKLQAIGDPPLPKPADASCETEDGLHATVVVSDDGYTVKARGSNIAPGCNAVGLGVTLPKRENAHDDGALAACLVRLRKEAKCETDRFVMTTSRAHIDLQTMVGAWEAVRSAGFDRIALGVMH